MKRSMIARQKRSTKFSIRKYNRRKIYGRPRGYLKEHGIYHICFRELAYKGEIFDVGKAS